MAGRMDAEEGRVDLGNPLSGPDGHYQILFESAPYGVAFHDAKGAILSANPVARRILDLAPELAKDRIFLRPRRHFIREDGSTFPEEEGPVMVSLCTGKFVNDLVMGVVDPATESTAWISLCTVPLFRPGETTPFQVYTIFQDITGKKRAEEAWKRGEERFATILHSCPVGIDILRLSDEHIIDVNEAWLDLMGMERTEVIGRTSEELGLYADPEERKRIFESLHRGTHREVSETVLLSRTKGLRNVVFSIEAIDLMGEPHLLTLMRDDTEKKTSETAIKNQLNFVNTLLDTLPIPIYTKDLEGRYLRCNKAWLEFHGLGKSEILGQTVFNVCPAEMAAGHRERDQRLLASPGVQVYEGQARSKDGSFRDVVFQKASYLDAQGAVAGIVGSLLDITELKRSTEALRESEGRVRAKLDAILLPEGDLGVLDLEDIIDLKGVQDLLDKLCELTQMGVAIVDLHGRVLMGTGWQDACAKFHRANPESCRNCRESDLALSVGVESGQFKRYKCKNHMWDMVTPIIIGGRHVGNMFLGQFFLEGETPDRALFRAQAERFGFDVDAYLQAIDAVPRWRLEVVDSAMKFYAGFGNMVSSMGYSTLKLARTMEERARAQEALEKSEHFLRAAQTAGRVGCFSLDIAQGTWESSETFDSIFNIAPDYPRDMKGWLELAAPEDREAYRHYMQEVIQHRRRFGTEFRTQRGRDGQTQWISGHGSVECDAQGQTARLIGTMLDITGRKATEEERAKLQEQLNQSQKLESIGRLAGGVAHDSNNMLMAILMHAELLREALGSDNPALRHVKAIEGAAERSSGLIHQLLAFSRKQVIEPKILDLNERLAGFKSSLAPLVGEDVEFLFRPAGDLWMLRMDPAQVDQVVMNLVVNARDAMPRGGTLSIETTNVHIAEESCRESTWATPGEFVQLTITDTGVGIPQEIQKKIFDPFFTTKDVGKGTGLGLSTVFGIVKQNGGFLNVSSEPGLGTTFRIYLPRHADPRSAEAATGRTTEASSTGKGHILVVEDDEILKEVIPQILDRLGYAYLMAENPDDALRICRREEIPIDILLTDVVMPGMSGKELWEKVRNMRPDLKVIYMSGYTADVISRQGVLDDGIYFIQKPFTTAALGKQLRRVMEGTGKV